MSQEGFGDSSSQESINPRLLKPQSQSQSVSSNILVEPTTLFNALPRQVLEQELQFCNERSQQAQVLLRQAQEQLQLSQLVIQRQETLTLTLQSRIDQLERELQDVHINCDELRDRLKRQQHHTSQLKAALERCLDTSSPAPKDSAPNDIALSALESWSIAKLADEKILPVEAIIDSPLQNVVKIAPAPQPIELPDAQEPNAQELEASSTEAQQPEPIKIPIHLAIPAKTQPISPLIVRAHKASQGSPIASFDKQLTHSSTDSKTDSRTDSQLEQQVISKNDHNFIMSNDSALSSPSALTTSTMISTVAVPKFIQSLYENAHPADSKSEEPAQLAIASSSSRKVVSSLAAVQLPQFAPLPRR